jgi:predicted DNA-binding mobile mystery protein A
VVIDDNMRAQDRATARRNLDKKLNLLRNSEISARPSRGWIKAVREALGMTTTQLGRRMEVNQSTIIGFEKAEHSKGITLETLERAAAAMGCRLVYALVPRESLDEIVEKRARALAKKHLRATSHSMALEDQSIEDSQEIDQLERLTRKLMEKSGSELWEDP